MSLVLGFVLLTAALGVPLFVIMGLLALVAFSFAGIQTSAVAVEIYKMAAAPTLLSIPLFAFAGYLMAKMFPSHDMGFIEIIKKTSSLCQTN